MSKKPWDIRDISPLGDGSENTIFTAIGAALTAWETVEVECARLFAVFVSARQKRPYHAPAVRAYGSIVGAHSRCKMLQLAAEAYFARRSVKRQSFEKQFDSLMGEYDQYANRRNEIAHGFVKKVFLTKRHRAIGLYLVPSFYNPKKYKDGGLMYLYVSGDLIHYRQEFTKLQLRIAHLVQQLS
jgi:hypothetical protein